MKLHFALLSCFLLITGCASPGHSETPAAGDWEQILDKARWSQNAHNMQSWNLKLLSATSLQGGLHPGRMLPETDPAARQLILSLGALTETARLSARVLGMDLQPEWIAPEGWDPQEDPAATLFQWDLTPLEDAAEGTEAPLDGLTSPTVKYATRPGVLSPEEQQRLIRSYSDPLTTFRFLNEGEELDAVKEIAREAFRVEMKYEPTLMESYNVTRYSRKDRETYPYGLTLMGNFPRGKIGLVNLISQLFPMKPEAYGERGTEMFNRTLGETTQILVMSTRGNRPQDQFYSGMAMQALWLEALAQGYTLLPLSQGLQEYPQVEEYYQALHNLLAQEGETIQMILAVNRPLDKEFLPSPRFPVSAMIEE